MVSVPPSDHKVQHRVKNELLEASEDVAVEHKFANGLKLVLVYLHLFLNPLLVLGEVLPLFLLLQKANGAVYDIEQHEHKREPIALRDRRVLRDLEYVIEDIVSYRFMFHVFLEVFLFEHGGHLCIVNVVDFLD